MGETKEPKEKKVLTTKEKIQKSAESIFKLGEKAGKDSAKSLAKSNFAKKMVKVIENINTKTEAKENAVDDAKVKKVCVTIASKSDLTYADLLSLATTAISGLAKKPEPVKEPKEKKAKKSKED